MKRQQKLAVLYLVSTIAAFGLACFLSDYPVFQIWENSIRRRAMSVPREKKNEYNVVVVAIDEHSFEVMKTDPRLAPFKKMNWPWPPVLHAQLLKELVKNGVERVGFDLLFSESFEQSYLPEYSTLEPLLAVRREADIPVILAAKRETGSLLLPLPELLKGGFGHGMVNVPAELEREVWRYAFRQRTGSFPGMANGDNQGQPGSPGMKNRHEDAPRNDAPSMAFSGYTSHRGNTSQPTTPSLVLAMSLAEGGEKELAKLGWTEDLLKDEQVLRFRDVGMQGFPCLSYTDVLTGEIPELIKERWGKTSLKELLEGRFVLIGRTSLDSHDFHYTPLGSMPGVFVHAHALQMLCEPASLLTKEISLGVSRGLVALMAILALVVFQLAGTSVWLVVTGTGFVLFYWFLPIWVFHGLNLFLPYISGMFGYLFNSLFLKIGESLLDRREKQFIQGAFGKYVSPAVAEKLLADPALIKLGGEEREITILFSDIAGFTSIAEKLPPVELIKILNRFMGALTREIIARDGTLDKYIGDAIMAFWGAPVELKNSAELACRAALAMQIRAAEMNTVPVFPGAPALTCRIGINTGRAVVGNAGCEERFSYTAIGDSVNSASRFEGLGKKYGVSIIIGKITRQQVGDLFDVRLLDRVRVKGKIEITEIYELLGVAGTAKREFVDAHQMAMNAFFSKKFDEAEKLFTEVVSRYQDGQSVLFLERLQELRQNSDLRNAFDGAWTMHEK